jgi:hypothetical protein
MPAKEQHNEVATTTSPRGYTDERGAAEYVSYSLDRFKELVAQGVFKRGRALTSDGKLLHKYSDLDAAVEKAFRTRKPRRRARGIVRIRQEAARARRTA